MPPTRPDLAYSEQSVSFISGLRSAAVTAGLSNTKPACYPYSSTYFLSSKTLISVLISSVQLKILLNTRHSSCLANPTFFLSNIFLFSADNVNYHMSSIFRVTHKTQFHGFRSGNIRDRECPDNDARLSITLRQELTVSSKNNYGHNDFSLIRCTPDSNFKFMLGCFRSRLIYTVPHPRKYEFRTKKSTSYRFLKLSCFPLYRKQLLCGCNFTRP